MAEETITITLKEYNQLKRDQILLNCLDNWGVDNWTAYPDAYSEFEDIVNEIIPFGSLPSAD